MAAVVTGAGSGIGRALASLLVEKGLKVFGVDRHFPELEKLTDVKIITVTADVGTAEGVEAIRRAVGTEAVRILAFVGGSLIGKPVLRIDRVGYDAMVGCNVMGPIFLTQALVVNLKVAGGARIILTTGDGTDVHIPTMGAYGSTKAALKTIWMTLRDECAEFAGVALAKPGLVNTPLWDPYLADPKSDLAPVIASRLEAGDCHTADEVAEWMVAMVDPAKVDSETFKNCEWELDRPDHSLGIEATETTEMRSFKASAAQTEDAS